jgi:hypothetical protein
MSNVINALNEVIKSKSSNKKPKVDWSNSPLLPIKSDKNNCSAGDFGEILYKNVIGPSATVVKKGHDVYVDDGSKVEVKTAFQGKDGSFFFNQIYSEKDWNKIAFVFVKPNAVEIWECDRNNLNFDVDFFDNNGYAWRKSSSSKLSSAWKKIYSEVY